MPRARRTSTSSGTMSGSSEFDEKGCTACERVLSLSCFYSSRSQCKECIRDINANKRAEASQDDDPQPKRPRLFEAGFAGSDLYVLALSTDPLGAFHGLKVGRSGNIPQRTAGLGESMPFNIVILATFPGSGHLEKAVHSQLETTRNTAGRGREWFHTTLPNITHAVACAMQSSPKTNAGSSSAGSVAPAAE
jgi:hypothetical protein